jgi:Kef-type K+ transport system membrane component KefB
MNAGFFELTIVLAAASALSIIAKLLKQPTILAYIAVGVLINQFHIFDIGEVEVFELFADMGIMFLLFLVGLEINYASLKMVGRVSFVLGIGQILFTTIGGFFIAQAFGFPATEAAYIAVALSFSSTIIIVKLLADKKDLGSLYGKISIGFLLVQDIVAIVMLVMLTSMEATGSISLSAMVLAVLKTLGLFTFMLWLGRSIMPRLFHRVAYSHEILFITSLAWVFGLAFMVHQIDFSVEIAGFLAGVALANSSEHYQIANRIRPLRDFFIMLFFVSLGTSFVLSNLSALIPHITTLSLYVLIGNPLIVITLMGLMGYRKRTGFMTGLTVAQISEFSLILMALGLKLGHVTETTIALVTAIGIVTITISTYLITYSNKIYPWLARALTIFEKKHLVENSLNVGNQKNEIILIGFHRTGRSLAHNLNKSQLLVVDFDPTNIPYLQRNKYNFIFGDAADQEVLDAANFAGAKLIISTSPDIEDNLILINNLKLVRRRPRIVVRAESEDQARQLYHQGADYVLLPHLASGHALGQTIAKNLNTSVLKKLRQKDLRVLSATSEN